MRRFDIERAVLAAELPGPSVGIMLSLCTRIYRDEGIIPQREQPSLSRIASDTGWDRSTVIRHLAQLEAGGWLTRTRPPLWLARQLHVTTSYALRVPDSYPQASGSGPLGLVALRGEARRLALQALEAHEAEARRAANGELADAGDGASGPVPRNPDKTESRDSEAPACVHGVPGGLDENPRTGKPRCPLCRRDVS